MGVIVGEKDKVLIIGATGYLGRRLVKASMDLGHPTFVLYRPEVASDVEKVQMLIGFKMQGATLLQGSLDDHNSLVSALRQVDVVVSAVAGNHLRHAVLEQLKLIEAIKEVGTIKRFLPSEFGMDVDRMEHAIPPGAYVFTDKRVVRRAIEKANIPYTYISANCCAGYFLAALAQLGHFMPPTDHALIYGDGDKKCIWVDEDDMAMYAMMAVDDPRALNKTLYLRPRGNILTQMEVVHTWEKIIGKELKKTFVSQDEWLSSIDKVAPPLQIGVAHLYQIFYHGDLEFEVEGPHGVDSNDLYPNHKYVTAEEYLKRFA
ncbi:bifunctional pinoresinol-lariciresinol reductase 2-like protein [Cinnamomum micranthum f. kanehirae]|uniref:Bifunctional pinoresinol-lariciresinol reductase 2-like protein n=1 Tax=Cinnamomum micranthum f. kanehirae TaxID=337451 RepID=A0A3S4N754_9MAGN|nr:bifunctional pinoresinol-lariciresinol reductase 2-like protein [Cinnamomum micranthum f. kanehirae]